MMVVVAPHVVAIRSATVYVCIQGVAGLRVPDVVMFVKFRSPLRKHTKNRYLVDTANAILFNVSAVLLASC